MRVLFWTRANKIKSAAARNSFYDMHLLLREEGIQADLFTGTDVDQIEKDVSYDIAVINHFNAEHIYRVLKKWPNCHIGIFSPDDLGIISGVLDNKQRWKTLKHALNNTDFIIVHTFTWRDLLMEFKKRIYLVTDQVKTKDKKTKQHTKTDDITIGYHGNVLHFKEDFFPNGAKALQRISSEYNVTLKIITNNAHKQPHIGGVKTEFVEFDLLSFENEIQTFDIGISPVISNYSELSHPLKYIRNSNRVNTVLAHGIPSITSPIPQSCSDFKNGETVLFAVTEEGWYQALKSLIDNPNLRNKIGHAGKKMVASRFSPTAVAGMFINMFEEEIKQRLNIKNITPPPTKRYPILERASGWMHRKFARWGI